MFDYGKVEDHTYENNFFNLKIKFADDWFIANDEQLKLIFKISSERVSNGDEKLKRIIRASEVKDAPLLFASKYTLDTKVEFNPNINVSAENMAKWPDTKNGYDYLIATNKLNRTFHKVPFAEDEIQKTKIGGKEFYYIKRAVHSNNKDCTIVTYSTVQNGFALIITVAYKFKIQEDEINSILHNIYLG
jgi:hypothetical protein